MKICFIHNFYTQAGGEDGVLAAEIKLLTKNHVENSTITKRSGDLSYLKLGLNFFFNSTYSKVAKKELLDRLKHEKPDLVHVHNFFPLFSPSIYDACHEFGIPIVQTLHNFRIIYPNALLYHNGNVDLRTIKGSAWQVVKDKVYHNSFVKTAVMSKFIEYHKKRNTWNTKVDQFIALTEFSKNIFVDFGIESSKISVKPNFQFSDTDSDSTENFVNNEVNRTDFALFVGRISEEKGILQLVKKWISNSNAPLLKIAGDGPLMNELKALVDSDLTNRKVEILGSKPKETIKSLMKEAKVLVFPSLWYEGFPMVLVEALSNGLPVITTNIGSQASIISNNYTGYHVATDQLDSMADYANELIQDSKKWFYFSNNAKREFFEKYTDEVNFRLLMDIYMKAINSKKNA